MLSKYPIGEVWGIGSRLAKVIKGMGVHNALDFREMDPPVVRKKLGVIGERLLWELRGLSCNHLEEIKPKKSITVSRSFGAVITDQETLAEALATFAAAASEKLRKQGSKASELSIFLGDGAEIESSEESFCQPTSDTSEIIAMAKMLLARIFTPKKRYKKCGVLLAGLILEDAAPSDLFAPKANPKRKALMHTIDALNGRFGKNRLFFAAAGVDPTWGPRKEGLFSHNTTEWDALPLVKA